MAVNTGLSSKMGVNTGLYNKTNTKSLPSLTANNKNMFLDPENKFDNLLRYNGTTSSNKNYSTYNGSKNSSSSSNKSSKKSSKKSSNSSSGSGGSSSSSFSYSGGGGVGIPSVGDYSIDLSDILNAYNASAEAQKQSILGTTAAQQKIYEDSLKSAIEELRLNEKSQREALSKSLQRFQEDTAKSRQQQQASFTSNRADLEAQAYLANRQALQSAAARGLGGSGLQQLAQLQNLINQSNATNDLATQNTDALNALAQSLARQEQDTTTALNELAEGTTQKINSMSTESRNKIDALLNEQKNKINEIEKNNTSTKTQLQYNEAVRSQEARTEAERFAAQMQAQNASIAASYSAQKAQAAANAKAEADALKEYNQRVNTNLANIIQAAQDSIEQTNSSKMKKSKKEAANLQTYYNAKAAIREFTNANNVDDSILSTYNTQLSSLLKNKKK